MSEPADQCDAASDDTGGDPGRDAGTASGEGGAVRPASRPNAAADDLLAAAEDLAGREEDGWRGRSATVRRPRRGPRTASEAGLLDDAHEPERARVRSSAEEVTGGSAGQQRGEEAALLDAGGQVIRPPGAGERTGVDGDPPPSGADRPGDATAFLLDAVRSYLAGVDAFGPDHELTRERRRQLRRTLELCERG